MSTGQGKGDTTAKETMLTAANEEDIVRALTAVIDPEIGVNIVDLGLVYSARFEDGRIKVAMTMTTPACPMNSYLTEMARKALSRKFPNAAEIKVDLVWDPPWGPQMMSDAARKRLGCA
jgi:metal-sulfur cluster biosynthetic enzyme